MRANFYAYVVWGFEVKFEEQTKQEKRFNERTGEPYFIDVSDGKIAYLENGYEFSREDSDDIDDEMFEGGLEVFVTTGREQFFIGEAIGKTKDIAYLQPPIVMDPKIPDSVLEFSKKCNVVPKLYLIPHCSY